MVQRNGKCNRLFSESQRAERGDEKVAQAVRQLESFKDIDDDHEGILHCCL